MMSTLPDIGKIQNAFYKETIFPFCGSVREEVLVGPKFGVDVSVIDIGNGFGLALTSDPLSFIAPLGIPESAWLSVQLMANDMATTGLSPAYAQFVLTLPPLLTPEDFTSYWRNIHQYCKDLGIAITGGHTGKFAGVNSTVVGGGTIASVGPLNSIITSQGAKVGDAIIITQEAAMMASAILAKSFPRHINEHLGNEIQQQASDLFFKTSAVKAGLAAGEMNLEERIVTAMHDVTECGVLGATYELCVASGCGAVIDTDHIPVGSAQEKICGLFEIDPLFTLGPGSMIITAHADKANLVIQHLENNGIKGTLIGELTDEQNVLVDRVSGKEIHHPEVDPYWKTFFNAHENGIE